MAILKIESQNQPGTLSQRDEGQEQYGGLAQALLEATQLGIQKLVIKQTASQNGKSPNTFGYRRVD